MVDHTQTVVEDNYIVVGIEEDPIDSVVEDSIHNHQIPYVVEQNEVDLVEEVGVVVVRMGMVVEVSNMVEVVEVVVVGEDVVEVWFFVKILGFHYCQMRIQQSFQFQLKMGMEIKS